jgi:hypothetical protein
MERRCVTGRSSENENIGRRAFGREQVANERAVRLYIAGRLYIEGRAAIPFISAVPMKLEGGGIAAEEIRWVDLHARSSQARSGVLFGVANHRTSVIGPPNRWTMLVMILDSVSVAG